MNLKVLFSVVIIFLIDLLIPLGVAVGVFYVIAILLVIKEDRKTIIRIAILCTVLTLIVPVITYTDGTTWMAFANRGISVLGILITSVIAIRHRILDENLGLLNDVKVKNEELNQYVSVISHDLKTPLGEIAGLIHFIESKLSQDLPEEVFENINLIKERIKRVNDLIEGLLAYSLSGKRSEGKNKISVKSLINEIISDYNYNDKIRFKLTGNDFILETDELLLNQVLYNLIQNSVKYNDKDICEIEVGYEKNRGFIQFYVKDNGPGIEEQHFDRVFKVFQSLNTNSEIESTGIGLSVVKKIIDQRNREIKVDSVLGESTTFTFTW